MIANDLVPQGSDFDVERAALNAACDWLDEHGSLPDDVLPIEDWGWVAWR